MLTPPTNKHSLLMAIVESLEQHVFRHHGGEPGNQTNG